MPVNITPEEFQEKHARRLKAATEDMRRGVERVSEAPGKKAAEKVDKWVAAITSSETQQKWARRVASVSLDDWKQKMISKGIGRVAAGIDAAAPKTIEFATKLIEHQNRGLTALERMPDLTLEDSVNRAATWIRHMANFKR